MDRSGIRGKGETPSGGELQREDDQAGIERRKVSGRLQFVCTCITV